MSVTPIQFKESDGYRAERDAIAKLTKHVNSLTSNSVTLLSADKRPSFTISITNCKTGIIDFSSFL